MRIAVVGYTGRFGSAAMKLLKDAGHTVIPVHGVDFTEEMLDSLDYALLAVPIRAALNIVSSCRDPGKLVEICSVKSPFRPFAGKIISIHPLFGPSTLNSQNTRNIIYIDDLSTPGSIDIIKQMFPGSFIRIMSSSDHDRAMIDLLVRPYILSMLADSTGKAQTDLTTRSSRMLSEFEGIYSDESREVMMDTIALNPYSMDILAKIRDRLDRIIENVENGDSQRQSAPVRNGNR
ncbi:MAG: hypothetical protein M1285_05445 [Candidatus Thermoplasmatota archaeon]|nr:hypothetical protein [Candidatus Thermoplasmatota archaeon]